MAYKATLRLLCCGQAIDPTGKRFMMSGMVMRRIAGGKIVERWDNLDWLSVFQQLGLIPA